MDHVKYPLEACAGAPADRLRKRAARHRQMGLATVEFGLLLPLLVLILSGILEFGFALYDKAVITNASREGARVGIVLRGPAVTPLDIENLIRTRVLNYAGNSLLGLGQASQVTVDFPVQSNPDPLAVRVDYTFRGLGLGYLLSAIGSTPVLTATTVMVKE